MSDTPTHRATINQMMVDELDIMLGELRTRRLERVKKLEQIAKVKSDDAQLVAYLKFERLHKIAKRHLDKLAEMEKRSEALVHKVRIAAMVVRLEVGQEEDEDASSAGISESEGPESEHS
jgi:hypothetical protein